MAFKWKTDSQVAGGGPGRCVPAAEKATGILPIATCSHCWRTSRAWFFGPRRNRVRVQELLAGRERGDLPSCPKVSGASAQPGMSNTLTKVPRPRRQRVEGFKDDFGFDEHPAARADQAPRAVASPTRSAMRSTPRRDPRRLAGSVSGLRGSNASPSEPRANSRRWRSTEKT